MNKQLLEKTKEWMSLERKTLEQRKIAETFYEENLMQLIVEEYIDHNKEQLFEDVECLVVSVGTSYEPIVLNICLLQPKRILFLCTEKSEAILGKIVNFCQLDPQVYEKSRVSETDPLDIYKEIKTAYLQWGKPEKMYIDFTGGTKAMSAAAAMAGAMVDIQLIYVGTHDYLTDFRKPNPGTESLYFITNPLAVFGDLEIEKALLLFQEYNYSGVVEKLSVLKESIPDAEIRQQLNFVYLLAKAYESWDSLDFAQAYSNITQLNAELYRDRIHKNYMMMDFLGKLKVQEDQLAYLSKIPELIQTKKNMEILKENEVIHALMFTMQQNAAVRELQEKYDMATLLLYRLLEMIEQKRLSKYNLFVSDMDYNNFYVNKKRMTEYLDKTVEERFTILKESVSTIKRGLFGKPGNGYLPDQVSLLEGYIILYAFHDPIVSRGEDDNYMILKRIRSMVFLRNNSIFAHGLGPVKKADYEKFRDFVHEMLMEYCKIERLDYGEFTEKMQYVKPLESENCISVEGK